MSPRKPQRTVDRALEIIDKVLQGVPWEARDSTLNLLEWDSQDEVEQTTETLIETRRAEYGECSVPETPEKSGK